MLAHLQTRQDHDVIIQPRPDLDLTRFEITVAMVNESYIARAGMQDARSRE